MEKTAAVLKKLNSSYKYVLYVGVFALGLSAFNLVANRPAEAIETNQQNTQQEQATTNQGLDDLKAIAQGSDGGENTNSSESSTTNSPQTTSDQNQQNIAFTSGSPSSSYTNVDVTISGLLASTIKVVNSMFIGTPSGSLAVVENSSGKTVAEYPIYNPGAISSVVGVTGLMYREPPASVETWATDILERVNPSVYAADSQSTYYPGDGQRLLSPIQKLWRAGTNIVYVFYILIMVGIAFMIVFRNKIGGDQTINLFNAIPSIIISLILVYFSYPLSAIFIDVITVGSGVVYGVLIGSDEDSKVTAPGGYLREDNYRFIFSPDLYNSAVTGNTVTEIDPAQMLQIDDKYVSVWNIFLTAGINPTTSGVAALVPQDAPISGLIGNIVRAISESFLGSTILSLVFAFAAFTASLKLFFKLLQEYVILMAYPIAAPFLFLSAAIPGRTGTVVSTYFRRLLSASVSFILVYALFLMVIIIARSSGDQVANDITWVPPLLGYTDISITGGQITNIARPLLAFALFLGIPPILEQVQAAISEPGKPGIGKEIIRSAAGGATGVYGVGKQAFGMVQGQIMK